MSDRLLSYYEQMYENVLDNIRELKKVLDLTSIDRFKEHIMEALK
jgi:hypothetical protein